MKAKYRHCGSDCLVYNQVICEDNIVTTVESYVISWVDATPKTETTVCKNEKEAINLYNMLCNKLQQQKYDCEYRD